MFKFVCLVLAFFGMLAVFHRQLIEWMDADGLLMTVVLGAVISGRLGLYVYRKSRGLRPTGFI